MMLLEGAQEAGLLGGLIRFDRWLFGKINQQWTNHFFDSFFPVIRQAELWLPFYIFLLFFITINFGKKGWLWAFSLTMTVVISDLISSSVVKHLIFRLRPCCDPMIEDQVRALAGYCPYASSSFTSSHASNHFAMSLFIFLTLKHTSRWWGLVFLWSFLICYAQVYVGLHFPLDVTGGTILGLTIGYCMNIFFQKQFGPLTLKQST